MMHHQQLHRRSKTAQQRRSGVPLSESSLGDSAKVKQETLHPSAKKAFSLRRLCSLLSLCTLLLSLLTYGLALFYFDWPPDGSLSNPDGSFDLSQGDWWLSPDLTKALRYMLVVAHPDDESLFFSPTLINLASPRVIFPNESNKTLSSPIKNSTAHQLNSSYPVVEHPVGHILCLSSGNADGLGFKRTQEMKASCQEFGIPSTACVVIDDPDLPDSMSVWWSEEKISKYVKDYVDLWKINAIITFDEWGVSSHGNHRAISAALKRLVQTELHFPMTFMLRSSSLIEKYSWLASLPLSLYRHHRHLSREVINPRDESWTNTDKEEEEFKRKMGKTKFTRSQHSLILSSPRQYFEGRRSFSQHVSQNVWFRRLWLSFSRYMWINELYRAV